ncbi:hypothetical protein OAP18_00490 [Gammaproteobacteria bacterium]|nr:hypothetical protein [Gammaproteobacteria bacterium]
MSFKPLSITAIIFLLSSCAQNVYFIDPTDESETPATVNLYMDAFGSVYPAKGLDSGFRSAHRYSGLYGMMRDESNGLCENSDRSITDVDLLCESALIEDLDMALDQWRTVQGQLWSNYAQEIYAIATEDGLNRNVAVLIHGFNVPQEEADSDYLLAQQRILKVSEGSLTETVFVKIYWDGFTTPNFLASADAWKKAQSSGPLVGFQLRRLFNGINELYRANNVEPAIRVLTHSSGAFVATATFGNPIAALPLLQSPKEDEYELFNMYADEDSGEYAIPQLKGLRVGMLAAATPSTSFIGPYNSDYLKSYGWLAEDTTLIISINPCDQILTKLISNTPCSFLRLNPIRMLNILGATGTGADPALFRHTLSPKLCERSIEHYALDFMRTGDWKDKAKDHAFRVYLQQDESTPFLKLLMGEAIDSDARIISNSPCDRIEV